ncbi:MAG: hypothetical protein PHQ72_09585 [Hespellia sp.]|nr:hypothetical protein [Hespellia sp.]
MPAYFSLTFELSKSKIAVANFCRALINSGLTFESGYWGFENDSFEDIIKWNQSHLDNNFKLGFTEHHSHDYKQMLFNYCNFSEVRVFVMNNEKGATFNFELIVPEDDLLNYPENNSIEHKTEKMEQLKSIAQKVWIATDVLAIQTGWEGSDIPPLASKIAEGVKPQIEPFCIIKFSSFIEQSTLSFKNIEKGGVLIENFKNWYY